MTYPVRVRILLARMNGDTVPCAVAAIDEAVWEHWDDAVEAAWIRQGKATWGIDYDSEFKVVVAEFSPDSLIDVFETPTVKPLGVKPA